MNILILGSGGREYTLAWKLAQSPKNVGIFIAPGNAGTSEFGENLVLDLLDFSALSDIINSKKIDLIVVGPEVPLVHGVQNFIKENHPNITCVGPSKEGAQLEGSKAFAKRFMARYEIPTAGYLEVTKDNLSEGRKQILSTTGPIVLKADGLAAGKGVLIIDDKQEALDALETMLNGQFGNASEAVVIEEFLDGIEFSVFVLTDGKDYKLLPIAKDYKRIGEGDMGLNTGGMGAVSPVNFVNEELMTKVIERIVRPTMKGIQEEKIDYSGFIFFGLIRVGQDPYVIEYNCRLGDPETEVIIPRLKTDLVEILESFQQGNLSSCDVNFEKQSAATVMLVSGGYPETYQKGYPIYTPEETDSLIIHAGTTNQDEQVVTNGGRVMAVTSLADTLDLALKKSYSVIDQIEFKDKYFRKDIGQDLL